MAFGFGTEVGQEHFIDRGHIDEAIREHRALAHLDFILRLHSVSLKDVGLPEFDKEQLGSDFEVQLNVFRFEIFIVGRRRT